MKTRALVVAFSLLMLGGAAPPSFQFPDTDVARHAAAYLTAFNTGREDAVRASIEAHVSKAALAQRSIDERVATYRELRDQHGKLTPTRVVDSADDHLQILVDTSQGETLDITFMAEPDAPHLLRGLQIRIGGPGGDATAPVTAATPMNEGDAIRTWSAQLDSLTRVDAFSGTALLARGDSVLFQSAYGEASREAHTPNRTDTKFNIGSINKMFTKIAVAQLAAQGKIDVDAPIDRYLPKYPKEVASKVTVRQLLQHRGGIGDIFGDAYDKADKSKLRRVSDWIPLFQDKPLAFEPGTKQQYSNGGYVLLGAIVEKASGEDYYDYIRKHIYQPAGMKNTDHYAKSDRVANMANGYTLGGPHAAPKASAELTNNDSTRPMRGSPAGGGYSTLADLLAFTRALRDQKLVKADGLGRGFEELVPAPDGRMGLGIGGGAPGLNASVEIAGDYTIVVLANLDPPTAERASATVRAWLPTGGSGGERVRVGGGAHGPSSGTGPEMRGPSGPERTLVPEKGVEVAMTRSDHLPALQVMINGKGPYRFALDTGGGGNASVDSVVAAALGLEVIGQARSGDPSGRNLVTVDLVKLASLEIGGARFEGVEASVRSGRLRRMGEPVDGILGFRLFQECLLTLDYPANRLRLDRGGLPSANQNDVLAFTLDHGIPTIRLQVDSVSLEAHVDAGAPGGFSLPASLEPKLAFSSPPKVVGHGRTIGNDFEIRAGTIKGSVRLAGYEYKDANVEFQPVFPIGNVGSRVLRDFRVTFDQKNGRMRLAKAT